ncbi:type III-B CRISPR module RAMP protein Cmr6 [Dethiobacter alkaliphilus]|uniref:type III-B CRISPR module RAMP protein Cmr6 n=1 Tax=Dethiobacter alkaliphilus TaxID=427926 RepID=UPI002227F81E|nr:type III-B CRISPR module RAMP protein Cmr6 [Dethiobacter alkaliphilus]MCW3488682.1 type III-B CRISPR module RAMP protein Cmr6 [Dethiobacter alkaliphilus]
MTKRGTVKAVKIDKNGYRYGFIASSGEPDTFFHFNDLPEKLRDKIVPGSLVEFHTETRRGKQKAAGISLFAGAKPAGANLPDKKNKPSVNAEGDGFEICLPVDTKEILQGADIDNFALRLNKTARRFQNKFYFLLSEKNKPRLNVTHSFDEGIIQALVVRRESLLANSGLNFHKFDLTTDWRLVVGLGSSSVYETGITLHHIYGVPYLPGTAVKGVTRNWVINELFKGVEGNKQEGAYSDPGFCLIFGAPRNSDTGDNQGAVIFHDAFPVTKPKIGKDVMTSHFQEYYTLGNPPPPGDHLSLNPIPFITVEDTTFRFCLSLRAGRGKRIEKGAFNGKTPLEAAAIWLKKALAGQGIGAKTAVGYGTLSSK